MAQSRLDIESLTHRAVELFHGHQWQEALTYFDQVAKEKPKSAEIHNYRARALESLGRHEEALSCLDLALLIDPTNVADLRNRAVVRTKLDRLTGALTDYDAALSSRPDDPDLLVRRAMVL